MTAIALLCSASALVSLPEEGMPIIAGGAHRQQAAARAGGQ